MIILTLNLSCPFGIQLITLNDLSNPSVFNVVPLPLATCFSNAFDRRYCKPTQIPSTMFFAATSIVEVYPLFILLMFPLKLSVFWTFFILWAGNQGIGREIFYRAKILPLIKIHFILAE